MRELGSPNPAWSLLRREVLTGPEAECASGAGVGWAAPIWRQKNQVIIWNSLFGTPFWRQRVRGAYADFFRLSVFFGVSRTCSFRVSKVERHILRWDLPLPKMLPNDDQKVEKYVTRWDPRRAHLQQNTKKYIPRWDHGVADNFGKKREINSFLSW